MAPRRRGEGRRDDAGGHTPVSEDRRPEDEKIIDEAKERFMRAQAWEIPFRNLYIADVKFANADPDNNWQWPDTLRSQREKNNRPMLTMNKVGKLCELIVNDARQNKPSVKISPTSEKVTFKAAEVWMGLIRHIEYISNAQDTYDAATESMVEGGIGWCRIRHDFVDDESFDQEVRISPISDHLGVYLDCDIKQRDGLDANWGFVFTDKSRKEWERENPDKPYPPAEKAADGIDPVYSWVRSDYIREAEYYRIVHEKDELIFMVDSQGVESTFRRSQVPAIIKPMLENAERDPKTFKLRKRPIKRRKLEWYKISGSEIIERRTDMKGSYVPLVRFVGSEKIIDGKLERKGHVRKLKDAQRMWNYNTSAQVEFGALQTKTPYVAAAAAIEGNQADWFAANTQNKAVLVYKHRDEDGNELPAPQRSPPPDAAPAYVQGLQVAAQELEMVSGQYQPQQPNAALERTPRAIDERQRKGETGTYHWIDAVGRSIRTIGVIILDLAPHIYDTRRIVKVLAKDNSLSEVQFDPDHVEAHSEVDTPEENEVRVLFNPKLAKCAVQADIGPAYATQREEAWNAFIQIITTNQELIEIMGDLGFLAADFPNADKIAERLRRHIEQTKPWLLDDTKIGPLVQQLQQQVQQLTQQLGEAMEKLAEHTIKDKARAEMKDIDVEDALTRRLTAVGNVVTDFKSVTKDNPVWPLVVKTVQQMYGIDLTGLVATNEGEVEAGGGEGAVPGKQGGNGGARSAA